nr:right-handed parallel beta-helix repeat-containing protein [uncultured Prevotella sp.]
MAIVISISAKSIYIAPGGNDSAAGTIDAPLATLPAAYKKVVSGDTVYFRGGTYKVTDEQVMKYKSPYAYVFALEKAGTASKRTCFMGYPGERPVFDFSALNLNGEHRFAAFYLGADYLHLRNFDIIGVPVRIKGHTQSECVSARKGSYCIVENLSMHDNMAIGYYQTAGSHNLVLNCDAYNNYDAYSEGQYGGNVDGFGCHVSKSSEVGNVFRNCRAWRNSDDGFDLINCYMPVEIDHCFAFFNGYQPTIDPKDTTEFKSAGDGNGIKGGGFGMSDTKQITFPNGCPQHYIHHCLAYRNKSNGIYSNHHLGGNRWEYNTSGMNQRHNYSMVNRKGTATTENVDVDGYEHILIGNVSWKGNRGDVTALNTEKCTLANNSFGPDAFMVADVDFVTVSPASFFTSRDAEGNLPEILFLVGKQGRKLAQLQMGYAWEKEASVVEQTIIYKDNEPCGIYTLQGQRVQQVQRGKMYIVNGKKVYVR